MTPTELRMGLPWNCGAHRTDGCVVVSYSPTDEEAIKHVQMLVEVLGEPWKWTHDVSNATAWFPIERFMSSLEPKCEVTDCPTEGPVNEHGVCAACWEAIPVGCSCGSGLPVSDEDWMKGCCEECYGSWAEGIREHFKGASE